MTSASTRPATGPDGPTAPFHPTAGSGPAAPPSVAGDPSGGPVGTSTAATGRPPVAEVSAQVRGGRRRRPLRALREAFAPLAENLGLVPAAPPVPLRTVISRFWPDLRPDRGLLLVGLVVVALLPLVVTAEVWLFGLVVDDVLVPQDLAALVPLAAAYVGLNLLSGGLSYAEEYLAARVGGRFLVRLRSALFGHLHTLSLPVLDRRRLGDLVSRLSGDVGAIEGLFVGGLTSAVSAVFRLLFFGVALFVLDWQLALAALALAPVFGLVARTYARRLKRASREKRRRTGGLSSVAEESLSVAALIRSHGAERAEAARFTGQAEDVYRAELAAARLRGAYPVVVDLVELAGLLAAIGLGTWALAGDRLTLGGLLAFLAYLGMLYRPIQELGDVVAAVFAASAGAERVIEVLDTEPGLTEPAGARPLPTTRGALEVSGVTYRYPGTTRPVLTDARLSVAPGEVVALLGPSGSGKTTVARLLTRLIDPEQGVVRIDGHDLRSVRLSSVRATVGLVLQEALLLDAGVRDNLLLARREATDEDLHAALAAVDALDFVLALPGGLDARVGQKGRSLSGGQRQRIALARAVLHDPPVLVLDEPSTGLDVATAERVLPRLLTGRTVVLITHDPAIAALADRVVHVADGRLAPALPASSAAVSGNRG